MQLGDFVLDLDAGTLTRASGGLVAMRPQTWALLETLARHAGQVVTKEQLLDAVWPGLVVSEGSIAQAVSALRAVLGDESRAMLRTVARRGYLLVPDAPAPAPATSTEPTLVRLPAQGGRLFGREAESSLLLQMLAEHRLVSLLGAGGVGKTVLALATAHASAAADAQSVVWVDLAPIADAALLPATLARAFELPASPGDDPLRGLLAALERRAGLLVLDNAEHLVEAVAQVVQALLTRAPGLHLLITSQVPLQLRSERRFRLDALALPQPDAPLAQAREAAAAAYFEDRAAALDRRFVLGDDNIASVVRICRRLEGLPLAIRLAAGRLHLLGLSALELHLQDLLEWPVAPERDAPSRQQTLHAALQWSYGLLAAPQQALFRRLGVFAGSFALDLAFGVAAAPLSPDGSEAQFAVELEGLVDRSLVDVVAGDPPRFRLLETQRAWALHELDRMGERQDAQCLHARAYASALERAGHDYWCTADAAWLPRWTGELDNIRAALRWSQLHDPLTAVRLVTEAEPLFRVLDLAHELRRAGTAIEAEAPVHAITDVGDALAARFHLAMASLEVNSASRRHQHAVLAETHARRCGDVRCLYLALTQQVTSWGVEAEAAQPVMAEAAALESPDWPPRLRCRGWLAQSTLGILCRCWPAALRAAETGFDLALQAGATLAKGAIGNIQLVAMLSADQVDAALERSAVLRSHVIPGPADTTILFCGTCARLWMMKGDLSAAPQPGRDVRLVSGRRLVPLRAVRQPLLQTCVGGTPRRDRGIAARLRRTRHRASLGRAALRRFTRPGACGTGATARCDAPASAVRRRRGLEPGSGLRADAGAGVRRGSCAASRDRLTGDEPGPETALLSSADGETCFHR